MTSMDCAVTTRSLSPIRPKPVWLTRHSTSTSTERTDESVSTATFKLGALHQASRAEKAKTVENPYAHAFTPDELSIAVNESNELLMIERSTGKYIVYSDQIGQTIFEMYANRIHQEVNASK